MTKFSANLGLLWTDRALPDAIRAAKAAGFDAVECHWPYDVTAADTAAALAETGLPMISLNTRRGNVADGDQGLAAIPERIGEARTAIDEAIAYAIAVKAGNVHVMAGSAEGTEAHDTFVANLRYACAKAAPHGIGILIEPLNRYDNPGYFLRTTDQARSIVEAVGADNLRIMFDCYHVQQIEGDVSRRLAGLLPLIGHIQFASVPDRGTPDHGELCYAHVFGVLREIGYTAPLGAEYRPAGGTDDSLGWMSALR